MPFFNGMTIRDGCATKDFLNANSNPFLEIKNTCLSPIIFVLFLEGATCVPPVGNTCLRDWCPGATPYRAFSIK